MRPDPLAGLRAVVSPYGLVGKTGVCAGPHGIPVASGSLGELGEVLPHLAGRRRSLAAEGNFDGAGGDLDPDRAELLSVAESVERYSALAVRDEALVFASADELGPDAVAPAEWPRASAAEFAVPNCPLTEPDGTDRIRWVRAWSLTHARPRYVPARLVWLGLPPRCPAELFTLGNPSGSAAHTDYPRAVLAGLLEVVERDALMLAWLHRLRLPRLDVRPDDLPESLRPYLDRSRAAALETRVFDATTDFGVPVFFALQLADRDPLLAQLVCTTAGLDPAVAVAKAYRELAMLRVALQANAPADPAQVPADGVCGGAYRSGAPEARGQFDFLLRGPRPLRTLAELPVPSSDDPVRQLDWAVARLRARGAEALAVDITSVEARAAGAVVVKVLVPQAVPLSFGTGVRMLATPRLHTAPVAMNHPARAEAAFNPHPQPMA
ncbi:YcaO-like family protein [Amycolatopsis sp. VS8301801F10]|uniref:YcaO-like family protein n=1 Tax=Amycolatopsis sp. VS8301801F10 TaxID=2652442 RepID=UPI0038FCA6B7